MNCVHDFHPDSNSEDSLEEEHLPEKGLIDGDSTVTRPAVSPLDRPIISKIGKTVKQPEHDVNVNVPSLFLPSWYPFFFYIVGFHINVSHLRRRRQSSVSSRSNYLRLARRLL